MQSLTGGQGPKKPDNKRNKELQIIGLATKMFKIRCKIAKMRISISIAYLVSLKHEISFVHSCTYKYVHPSHCNLDK